MAARLRLEERRIANEQAEERARERRELAEEAQQGLVPKTPVETPPPSTFQEDELRKARLARMRREALAAQDERREAEEQTALENEARQQCRWQNVQQFVRERAEGTSEPIYQERAAGFVSSRPICAKGTRPEVLEAARRIAARMTNGR